MVSFPASESRVEKLTRSRQEAVYDRVLVKRYNKGDQSAFTEIFERYYRILCGIAFGFLRNASDAEEVAMDVLWQAHKHLRNFRGDSSLATWLHSIARNRSINRLNSSYRVHYLQAVQLDAPVGDGSGGSLIDLLASPAVDAIYEIETGELAQTIEISLSKLNPCHQEILVLRCSKHLSYKEISKILGIGIGTVKSRIARARESLHVKITKM